MILYLWSELFANQPGIGGTDKSHVGQVINNLFDHFRLVRPQGSDVKLGQRRHFGGWQGDDGTQQVECI
jgi:hypothetical protein